ncbi:MAG: hypothetical protein JWO32_684 [Bacteroidetes bacterium]|nr:hypothetical protein [Bacteroidota bacterium]
MKIEKAHNGSDVYSKLQNFISAHKLLFNSAAWLKNYQSDNISLCAILNNNSEIIGCFHYYTFKKAIFKFVITAPFSPNIDLFYINPSLSVVGKNSFNKEISETVANYFDSLKVPYVNINLPDNMLDTQPFIWKGYLSRTRFSYLIDLSVNESQLWDNLSSEKRKSINKAGKDGLVIEQSTNHQLIYSLIIKSLERNELAKNQEIIRNILFSFSTPQNSFAFVAYNNSLPIGATFCVINNNKAIYLFGGFDSENKHHGAGVSCMWQSILTAKKLGLNYFDFEGSMDSKIERYFREFGGELISYFTVQKIKPLLKLVLRIKKHNPI